MPQITRIRALGGSGLRGGQISVGGAEKTVMNGLWRRLWNNVQVDASFARASAVSGPGWARFLASLEGTFWPAITVVYRLPVGSGFASLGVRLRPEMTPSAGHGVESGLLHRRHAGYRGIRHAAHTGSPSASSDCQQPLQP